MAMPTTAPVAMAVAIPTAMDLHNRRTLCCGLELHSRRRATRGGLCGACYRAECESAERYDQPVPYFHFLFSLDNLSWRAPTSARCRFISSK